MLTLELDDGRRLLLLTTVLTMLQDNELRLPDGHEAHTTEEENDVLDAMTPLVMIKALMLKSTGKLIQERAATAALVQLARELTEGWAPKEEVH